MKVRVLPRAVKGKDKDMDEKKAIRALIARAIDIERLCKSGVQDEDQYIEACSFIALLYRIQHRTEDQERLLGSLLNLTSPYEEKHYQPGN